MYKVFMDPKMPIWTTAHFLDPLKVYIFTQSPLFVWLFAYLDESLEEMTLMFFGRWGWFGNGNVHGVEVRELLSPCGSVCPFSFLFCCNV
jgi:hypothetical protein